MKSVPISAPGTSTSILYEDKMLGIEPLFESERLAFRRWQEFDIEFIFALYSDPDVIPYIGDGDAISIEDTKRWLEVTNANFEKRGYGMISIIEKASGEMIGCIGIVHPGQQPSAEVKYALFKSSWGKGLAPEAVKAITQHARSSWGVKEIIATVHSDNVASAKVLTRAGFTQALDRIEDDGSATSIWELPFTN